MTQNTIEKRLETNFVHWCNEHDIVPIKGPVATSKGFPDRFLQLPNFGGTIYVEFKGSSYYDLTPMQQWWRDYIMQSNPLRYFMIDTTEDLEALKQRCITFMRMGVFVLDYERKLIEQFEKPTDTVTNML